MDFLHLPLGAIAHACGWTLGALALPIGGLLGSFYRAYRSPTQETWSEYDVFGWRLPSPKTLSDMIIGGLCSMGLPAALDNIPELLVTLLPALSFLTILKVDLGAQPARLQFVVAFLLAFFVSWEATARSWILREREKARRGEGSGEPTIKNAASALQPAKSIDELQRDRRS